MRRSKQTKLSEEDLKGITNLMQSGLSFQHAITIIKDEENEEVITRVEHHLQSGESIESFFPQLTASPYPALLDGFLQFLCFEQSLSLAIYIQEENHKFQKHLKKTIFYPLFLFITTMLGMIVFNEICFPSLLSMLNGFRVSISSYLSFQTKIRIFYQTILIISLFTMVFAILMKSRKYRNFAYDKIYRIKKEGLIVQFVSILYMRYFLIAIDLNMSTKDTLQALINLQQPIISSISKEMVEALESGESFLISMKNAKLDPFLVKFLNIALHTNDVASILSSYHKAAKEKLKRKLENYMKIIQVFCYSCIGVVLILIYKVMMIPLTIINTL